MKRLLDILLACVFTLLAAPLFLIVAVLIKLDAPGPVMFKQKRAGKDAKPFDIYKFRTMVEGAEKMGPLITAKSDPRITQIGRILRWLKIDELPQLINVLNGTMSLVGPRPEVLPIVETYSPEQRKVLSVKPGIIGPSQIKNRDEESMLVENNADEFYIREILPKKIQTDLAYVQIKNPFKDVSLLVHGILAVILGSLKMRYIFESRRRIVFLLLDLGISAISLWVALALRFEGDIPLGEKEVFFTLLPFLLLMRAPSYIYFGLYQTLWQYLGTQELLNIVKAVTMGSLFLPFVPFLLQIEMPPRSVLIMDWFLLMLSLGGSRIVFKLTAERLRAPRLDRKRKNVLIIGAEDAGENLVREFIKQPAFGYRAMGFLDDDPQKVGVRIHGVKVMGKIAQLPQVVKLKKVDEVIIALPHSSGPEIAEIIKNCRQLHLPCRIVPSTSSLVSPRVLPTKLRPVDISDLLGRTLIEADVTGIQHYLQGKTVLITGAGGSIGSELARIIFQHGPRHLILVDNSESNLYEIEMDLNALPSETVLSVYLRDITRADEMREVMSKHKPQVIYHAAAYKHVPMMEAHYRQGVLTNVLGTKTMADLALEFGSDSFVLISTDKAIRPRSIMGTTKRIGELYTQSRRSGKTKFLSVRFGNVFNSKGSVVPLFKRQIEQGGPITITHPDMKRYFMDVSEAVFLILQATILGTNSEIFILDMGRPVKIVDLAKNLIQLAGLLPQDIAIKYTGLRPGEKMEEEIEIEHDRSMPTGHKKIRMWKSPPAPADVEKQVERLISIVTSNAGRDAVVEQLQRMVSEYRPFETATDATV